MSGVGLDALVAEEVIEHLADDFPRFLSISVVEVDVQRVGVVLVPDTTFTSEGRDAAFGRCAGTGEAHDVLRLGEDFSGLPDYFGVVHNAVCFQVQS